MADRTRIRFIGVWDTVGALGIPVPFWGTLGEREFLFHDTEPSSIIDTARHAVSIDEDREDFAPTLWDPKPGLDLEQVWFAGVHSDVGGGYPEAGLGHCAGQWIVSQAQKAGLKFEAHLTTSFDPDPKDKQHNQRKGIYRLRGRHVRKILGPVHRSVRERWQADVQDYRKKSLPLKALLDSVGQDWSKIKVVD